MGAGGAITVLGLGNILLQDEGFGVHFVRWFSERNRFDERVAIVDGGTLGYNLLDTISSSDHVIVIDVIKSDAEPGTLYRFSREEMELAMPGPTSAHEVEFLDVLHMAELSGSLPGVTFLCIVPESYGEMNLEMTQRMWDAFPLLERLLLKELERLGVSGSRTGALDA
ncbi:MAG: HyaD/HybD family hydrogenase maturation endopeptidase [Desulfomonilia bacterium]|jgi:hydrogenase maturation protease